MAWHARMSAQGVATSTNDPWARLPGRAQIQPWYHIRDSQEEYEMTCADRIGYR
jgi:hypothetical protein